MQLTAVLPRQELDALLRDALPLLVLLGADRDDRSLRLYDPGSVEFIAGHGIALSCKAEIRWALFGVSVPIQLRALTVMLVPRIDHEAGVPGLMFDLALDHVDLAGVPAVVGSGLVDLINQALSMRQVELGWRFGKTLSHAFALPALLASWSSFNLGVGESAVAVLSDALRLDIVLRASVTRR
jgi:hypothetical protein